MHVSCMSQHISCAQIQKISCMKFPVIILNSSKFHACYMHDSWNIHVTCRDLGHFSGMKHACYMHGLVPKFHACSMHQNMHISCMKRACSRCILCMVQAYFMRGTGVFHAWYRRIPCIMQVHSMCRTGIFHSCVHHAHTVQLQAY